MPDPVTSAAGAKMLISPTFIAGVAGSVLSLKFATNLNAWGRATSVAGGAVIAQFGTPLVAHILNLDAFQQAIGFFLGLFGLSFVAAIYETVKKADPWGLIMSRYGKNGGDNANG